jgi:hypothetical protein
MTRFGALDRELAEAVLHTMILVARDGVHALDDVHRRLGLTTTVGGPAQPEPPGERWRSLLGDLFQTRVHHADLPGVVVGCPPSDHHDERSAAVVGRLVGAAGAFLTAESLVFEERLDLLVPYPGTPGGHDAVEVRCLLDRVSVVADDVLDHADPGGWHVLVERYRVPEQSRPGDDGPATLPVLVFVDHTVVLTDIAFTLHRQILAVRGRHRDRDLDVRFPSDQQLRAVLEVAKGRAGDEPDPRIRWGTTAGARPAGGMHPPVVTQLRQLTRCGRPPHPGHLIVVAGGTAAPREAAGADLRLALLDLDLQDLLPNLDGWTVTCVDAAGPDCRRNVDYLRELCLAGGARSFDVVGVQTPLPQPSRNRERVAVVPDERRGNRRCRPGPLRAMAEPPRPSHRGGLDASARQQWLRARIRQLRWQSAQVLEGHVVGPHGQNLTVREAQARADLLDGLIEVEQGQGSLRHRRISNVSRSLAVLAVTLLDLPIMLWLTTSGLASALGTPTWLAGLAGGLLALLATGSAAIGLHQLGRNQRQYKNSSRQLVWAALPVSTKNVLIGVAVLATTTGAAAAARVYAALAATGLAPVGWVIAGAVGGVLTGSAGCLFWAAFRDGSLERDDLRHYSECVRPLLVQKKRHDEEELELRREYQRLAGAGERSGDAAPSLDDLRRRAGDLTDAQLMDRSLGEHGTSPALLAYAERWNRTESCQELLTMVREKSGPLAEHPRRTPSEGGPWPSIDGQITAAKE